MNQGESFAFETTLSGRTWIHLIEKAKSLNYRIVIYFIYLNKLTDNIKRRHRNSFQKLKNLYLPLADDWYFFNNSAKKPKLTLARSQIEKLTPNDQDLTIENFF